MGAQPVDVQQLPVLRVQLQPGGVQEELAATQGITLHLVGHSGR